MSSRKFLCALRALPEARTCFLTRVCDLTLPLSAKSSERKLRSCPSGVFSLLNLERADFLGEIRRDLSVNQSSPFAKSSNGEANSSEEGERGLYDEERREGAML